MVARAIGKKRGKRKAKKQQPIISAPTQILNATFPNTPHILVDHEIRAK
jgi:hypothetical protein